MSYKIDFTTFEYKKDTFSDAGISGFYYTVKTYTVQNDGLFYISGQAALYSDSGDGAGFMHINKGNYIGGENIAYQRLFQKQSSGTDGGSTVSPNSVVRLSAGDTITWTIGKSTAYSESALYWKGGMITVAQLA